MSSIGVFAKFWTFINSFINDRNTKYQKIEFPMEQYSLSTTNKSDKIFISLFVTFTYIPRGIMGLQRHQYIIKKHEQGFQNTN